MLITAQCSVSEPLMLRALQALVQRHDLGVGDRVRVSIAEMRAYVVNHGSNLLVA